MKINYFNIFTLMFLLAVQGANSATWEKLYSMKNTDCFRNVREVPAGGYVVAGYTSNLTANDTDALVMRMNDNGDTLWTLVYNGTGSKEDCLYKIVPTADGGFIACGYSKSFGNGDNAFYMKISSTGSIQWVKNWGGSGIERAQDIIQLSDGKYVLCGYTTTSPARYYDAFILKIDQNGNTLWSKTYGTTAYDDANSIKVLPDDGFIMGGQSNNDLYLIRTDQNGDSLWTKRLGTTGVDNIECINYSQGGNGFIIAGTTTGLGAGGEDAYIVVTDTGGTQLWSKTIGGTLNDGFHRVEQTTDGGYVASGTSSEGPWANPNIWIVKLDVNGNTSWQNYFGGNNHDHGYSGQQTSDGGYIVVGHTHSFTNNSNNEDAIVVKLNSSGQNTTKLYYSTVSNLISPTAVACGSANVQVTVEITNWSDQTLTSIPVTVEITGAITQTLTQTLSATMIRDQVKTMTFTTPIDMSVGGTFNFHCYTGFPHDVIPAHNFFDKSISVGASSSPLVVTNGSHCGPYTLSLSATSPDPVKWYTASTGGSSIFTGTSYTTPFLTSTTTYYAQAGTTCPSSRVPVMATISSGITAPTVSGNSRCGTGTVVLSASSGNTIKWFTSATAVSEIASGTSYTTPSISSNTTYYVSSESASCTSNRVAVNAVINGIPATPVANDGARCGSGTIILTATGATTLFWYTVATGGTSAGTGTSFTTPTLTTNAIYYVASENANCVSTRLAVNATVNSIPSSPVGSGNSRCGSGTVSLSATGTNTIKWYTAATGGASLGSGNTFTTPSISTTTTFYAASESSTCASSRVSVTATVIPAPANPVVTSNSRCGNGTVILSATGTTTLNWYTSATGGSPAGTGTSFTTPALSATTNYYVASENGTCSSSRVLVSATIYNTPSSPLANDNSICGPGAMTLSASGTNTIKWYTSSTGGTAIGTGNSFTTPSLTINTIYYVSSEISTCVSPRVAIQAIINPVPSDPIVIDDARCGDGTLTLTASAIDPIKWYDASSGGNLIGSGNSIVTPFITTTTTFYAIADDGTCQSNPVNSVATINSIPTLNLGSDTVYIGAGSYLLDAGTGFSSYLWSTSDVGQTYLASVAGNYCVTGTDANNCTVTDCQYIELSVVVNDISKNAFSIFPNPSSGIFSITYDRILRSADLSITDLAGKNVFSKTIAGQNEIVNLKFLPAGIYLVRINDNSFSSIKKLIIQ